MHALPEVAHKRVILIHFGGLLLSHNVPSDFDSLDLFNEVILNLFCYDSLVQILVFEHVKRRNMLDNTRLRDSSVVHSAYGVRENGIVLCRFQNGFE